MKSQIHLKLVLIAALAGLIFAVTDVVAKKPADKPSRDDPVFTALAGDSVNDLAILEPIDSYSIDQDVQIVFRRTLLNLDQFEGTDAAGDTCILERPALNGIMVLRPKSKKVPTVATFRYWFQAYLDSGQEVTHWFFMEGEFDDLDNWPPSFDTPATLILHSWEFSAENKWAQRQDCAGEGSSLVPGYDGPGPWTVTVVRKE